MYGPAYRMTVSVDTPVTTSLKRIVTDRSGATETTEAVGGR